MAAAPSALVREHLGDARATIRRNESGLETAIFNARCLPTSAEKIVELEKLASSYCRLACNEIEHRAVIEDNCDLKIEAINGKLTALRAQVAQLQQAQQPAVKIEEKKAPVKVSELSVDALLAGVPDASTLAIYTIDQSVKVCIEAIAVTLRSGPAGSKKWVVPVDHYVETEAFKKLHHMIAAKGLVLDFERTSDRYTRTGSLYVCAPGYEQPAYVYSREPED